jgi:predicted S18 family serine protease
MAICLDTELSTCHNAVPGHTRVVSEMELKRLSDEGYTHAQAAKYLHVPDSTFRTFLNRVKLRHLFTKNKAKKADKQPTDETTSIKSKENHHMTTDGREEGSE